MHGIQGEPEGKVSRGGEHEREHLKNLILEVAEGGTMRRLVQVERPVPSLPNSAARSRQLMTQPVIYQA